MDSVETVEAHANKKKIGILCRIDAMNKKHSSMIYVSMYVTDNS
jgi:hypothetical protein